MTQIQKQIDKISLSRKDENKHLEYYKYDTAKVTILWNGITQPEGFFKSAIEAKNYILDKFEFWCDLSKFQIKADGVILNLFSK